MAGSYTSDTHAQTENGFVPMFATVQSKSTSPHQAGTKIIRIAAKLKRKGKASVPFLSSFANKSWVQVKSKPKLDKSTRQRGFEGWRVHLYFASCAPAHTFSQWWWSSHADSFKPIICDTTIFVALWATRPKHTYIVGGLQPEYTSGAAMYIGFEDLNKKSLRDLLSDRQTRTTFYMFWFSIFLFIVELWMWLSVSTWPVYALPCLKTLSQMFMLQWSVFGLQSVIVQLWNDHRSKTLLSTHLNRPMSSVQIPKTFWIMS